MKISRMLVPTLRLVTRLTFSTAILPGPLVISAVALTGCADENDPATWAKRLDEPAQRSNSVKRLSHFFEDAMTKTNKNRSAPEVTEVLDKSVEPVVKQYTGSQLDDKTRKEAIKFLSDTRDLRAAPAIAKAFSDYEPGKNDEDVKFASQWVISVAGAGKLQDIGVIDALWGVFSKFQTSKAKSLNLVKDLHDAVLAAVHPSFGPKAIDKLNVPVDMKDPDSVNDQLQFWQLTAIQVIGELKFVPATKALVQVLLSPDKKSLRPTVTSALMKMPKEAETLLIAAYKGTDPDFSKLTAAWGPDASYLAVLADSISWISRPAGRATLIASLPTLANDTVRTVVTQSLVRYHADPPLTAAFIESYKKVTTAVQIELLGGLFARPALAQASSQLYDPSVVEWLLKESSSVKGDEGSAMQLVALEAAVKVMLAEQVKMVGDAVNKYWEPARQDFYKQASIVVQQCVGDPGCYYKVLDQPIPSNPPIARMKALKAAWMCAILGNSSTKDELVNRVDKVKDASVRLAMVEAIDQLAPGGDTASADKLDKIVAADKVTGDPGLLAADDALVKVALRLRARAMP